MFGVFSDLAIFNFRFVISAMSKIHFSLRIYGRFPLSSLFSLLSFYIVVSMQLSISDLVRIARNLDGWVRFIFMQLYTLCYRHDQSISCLLVVLAFDVRERNVWTEMS